jgi:choline kinase
MCAQNSSDGGQVPKVQHQEKEAQVVQCTEAEVDRLLEETRLWRAATSVLWVAWAIVQADLDKELAEPNLHNCNGTDVGVEHSQGEHQKNSTDPSSSQHAKSKDHSANVAAPSVTADKGFPDSNAARSVINRDEAGREEGAFDYLGCAQDRVLVFWGDVVKLGIVSASGLPEKLLKRIKICDD